jgi:hypothetical protein
MENEELKKRILGITAEVGGGVATDYLSTGLLAFGPLGWLGYGAVNFGQGAYTNYLVQKHLYGNENINWGEVISSGGMGMIPFSQIGASAKAAKYVGRAGSVKRGIVSGAGVGLAGEQLRVGIDEKRVLNPLEAGLAVGIGGGLGGALPALKDPGQPLQEYAAKQAYKQAGGQPVDKTLLAGKILASLDINQPNQFNFNYIKSSSQQASDKINVLVNNSLVQGGTSKATGYRFNFDAFAAQNDGFRRLLAGQLSTADYLSITNQSPSKATSRYATRLASGWKLVRDRQIEMYKNIPGMRDAMANYKEVDAAGNLVSRPILDRELDLDHAATLVQGLGMFHNTRPASPMWDRIQIAGLKRNIALGDAEKNLKIQNPFAHGAKTAFFNNKTGEAGAKWWRGQHRDTGYTRLEWMEGKARRKGADGKTRMTDIWDAKTRRQKYVSGTGAAADAHMEVVDDWFDLLEEGDKILKAGQDFFEANELPVTPEDLADLLQNVDVGNYTVPKLKRLFQDAVKAGIGVPIAKKTKAQWKNWTKQNVPILYQAIIAQRKQDQQTAEFMWRIIGSEKELTPKQIRNAVKNYNPDQMELKLFWEQSRPKMGINDQYTNYARLTKAIMQMRQIDAKYGMSAAEFNMNFPPGMGYLE